MANGAGRIAERQRRLQEELKKYPYSAMLNMLNFNNEMHIWCRENCQGKWLVKWHEVRFDSLDDCTQFKLTWI
jgi:hypothetical protein